MRRRQRWRNFDGRDKCIEKVLICRQPSLLIYPMKFFVLHKPLCPLDSVIHWIALSDRVHNCQNEILDDEIAKKKKTSGMELVGRSWLPYGF